MQNDIKLYESYWISRYIEAKEFIKTNYPEKLEDFIARLDVFRTDPNFKIKELPGLLNQEVLDFLRIMIHNSPKSKMELHEAESFGRIVLHNSPIFDKIQAGLTDRVSEWVGEAVEPSYNFLSLYSQKGVCEPHIDSVNAKWTLDICIEQSDPWPIHFSQIVPWLEEVPEPSESWQQDLKNDPQLKFQSKVLEPGNAILFAGSSQWHYRDPMPKTSKPGFCHLLFLHFRPKGSSEIVHPHLWAEAFDIPELAPIMGDKPTVFQYKQQSIS